jgi:hypothetical protein
LSSACLLLLLLLWNLPTSSTMTAALLSK